MSYKAVIVCVVGGGLIALLPVPLWMGLVGSFIWGWNAQNIIDVFWPDREE